MEFRDYVRVIRRRWVIVAVVASISVMAAAGYSLAATPQYASTTRLFVTTHSSDTGADLNQGGMFSAQRVTSYANLVQSEQLAATVAGELDLGTPPSELSERVTASVVPDTVNLEITVSDPSPAQAQALAQAYAESLVDLVRQLETPAGSAAAPIRATIVDPASLPNAPVSPQPVRNIALGIVLGLLTGTGLALLRDLFDTTVKSPEDLASVTNAPILGGIIYDASTRQHPLVSSLDSHSPRAEAFRVLRTNLQFIEVDAPDKVFVVTSAVPEEGKSTTSVNLGITMAQAGHRTLLIEGDLRRPKATSSLGLDDTIGVTTVLLGKVDLGAAIQEHPTTRLNVLASGAIPPNPAELLQSNAMADLLKMARDEYDIVIIDAPPLLPVTDAALLAAQADGAVLVVRHGKTTREQLAQAIERLEQVDATPVGVLLNMVPAGRGSEHHGYGYGYAPEPTRQES